MRKPSNKIIQEYNPKPIFNTCSNCKHISIDKIKNDWGYTEEKNIHCSIGNFAVKKLGTCRLHEIKEEAKNESHSI